jgi:hypothetical protein
MIPDRAMNDGELDHRLGRIFESGRRGRALANAVMVLLCAGVVIGLAILNSTAPAPVAPTFFPVTLVSPSDIGAVNRNLTHIGARVRVVPLRSSCGLAAYKRRYQLRKVWSHGISAEQAPAGEMTVVVASRRGLTGVSFQVHGPAPRCLPVTGALPYRG